MSLKSITGTFQHGQLLLDEAVDSAAPRRVIVTFMDEDKLMKPQKALLHFNTRPLRTSSGETFRREDMYGPDMR